MTTLTLIREEIADAYEHGIPTSWCSPLRNLRWDHHRRRFKAGATNQHRPGRKGMRDAI